MSSAAEVAEMILRIDDVIMGKKQEAPKVPEITEWRCDGRTAKNELPKADCPPPKTFLTFPFCSIYMSFAKIIPFLHLVLLPFVAYFVFTRNPLPALILLAISVVSEVVGKTLRKRDFSFLHPFSDKIMVLTLLFVLMLARFFSEIIFAFFVFRDLIIGSIRMLAARDDVVIRGRIVWKNDHAYPIHNHIPGFGRRKFSVPCQTILSGNAAVYVICGTC